MVAIQEVAAVCGVSGDAATEHRLAAERFVRFAQSGQAAPVLREHAPFLRTEFGRRVWNRLSILADLVLCGDVSVGDFEAHLRPLAVEIPMPLDELKIIARLALEGVRCCFFGQGNRPIVDVDEEGGGT